MTIIENLFCISRMPAPARIRKLPDEVVMRIAAGEVLLRPVNAVKELIENSIDAHSTSITVQIHSGGLRGLQVTDDGDGIHADDLALLCERHATSKLHAISDMSQLSTFGFRGEALASMSVAGRVRCVTKRKDSHGTVVGFKACYVNGRMVDNMEPVACNPGTTITVDDLFYAFPERRKTFLAKSADEYSRVFELLCKYSVAFGGRVGFSLKRDGRQQADLLTSASSNTEEVVRAVHGSELADNLLIVDNTNSSIVLDEGDSFLVSLKIIHSNPYYRRKEQAVSIFVNDRLVEWSELQKMVKMVYGQIVLSGWHPWVMICLTVPPERIDVNISPTKHTVMLADNESIVEFVKGCLENSLKDAGKVKRLPTTSIQSPAASFEASSPSANGKLAPYKRLYSDHRDTKIDHFFSSPRSSEMSTVAPSSSPIVMKRRTGPICDASILANDSNILHGKNPTSTKENIFPDSSLLSDDLVVEQKPVVDDHFDLIQPEAAAFPDVKEVKINPWDRSHVRLLRDQLESQKSEEVSRVIKRHVMVGVGWEGEKTFLQYENCLMVVNTIPFAHHFFYSTIVNEIGRLKEAVLLTPVNIYESVLNSISTGQVILDEKLDKQQVAKECVSLLSEKAPLFLDYFSIKIVDGNLLSVPNFIPEPAIPKKHHLGVFIFRLAVEVPWGQQADEVVLEAICSEIAMAYTIMPFDDLAMNNEYIKNRLFPAMKTSPYGFPSKLAKDGHIRLVTDLHTLYKQFDRC